MLYDGLSWSLGNEARLGFGVRRFEVVWHAKGNRLVAGDVQRMHL